jgi:serine phosphatase RsbU (regulator of sigma subunit)
MSFDIKKNLKDTMGMAMETNNLGEVYDSKGDAAKALSYFFESLSYSQKIHYQKFVIHTSQMISEIYFKQKNYEKAYEFYKLCTNLKDSVFNENNAKSLNEIEAKYQNEKKQLLIDNLNKENTIKEVKIEKQQNKTYFLYAAAGLLCLIIVIAAIGYRNKQNANRIISEQKAEVERQRDQIEAKSKEVTDSILYAKRIQGAMLANTGLLKAHLPEHFVLYKPKDIVSGDFYWAGAQDNKFYLCAGDCTGHGVPGAFMSLLNISFLNEAVIEKRIESPEKILDHVRNQIITSLSNKETGEGSRDGMDAVLCMFDMKGMWLRFAAANNPLWLIRNNELKIFAPDKMPVGMHHGRQKDFTLQTLGLRKNDIVYLLTDGYADQFGGDKGKKFKYKKLQDLLLKHCDKSMEEQKEILDLAVEQWRGKLEQVDDILVIGIKF